jgi:putative SOS response-associated peptidase YedK
MCGRFTLHTEKELLQRQFQVELDASPLQPRYNIAPSESVLTVRHSKSREKRVAERMRWGLVPYWSKPLAKLPNMINARVETVATKPAYREPLKRRRCLVLADGFYEWQSLDRKGPRQPFWISLKSGEPFGMAAVWDLWRDPDDRDQDPLITCSIVTAPANPAIVMIHARMPVILPPERAAAWLDPAHDGKPAELLQVLAPVEAGALQSHPVSAAVNSPDNDNASLLDPVQNPAPTLF